MSLPTNEIIEGDCLRCLRDIEDDSVDAVVTSPPYWRQRAYNGLGVGNEESLDGYLDGLMAVFEQCLRVVKPHGTVTFNLGDKYGGSGLMLLPYRFAIRASERAYLVNELTWVKTNPTPRQDRRKLVPATEPFFIFAKQKDYYFARDDFLKVDAKQNATTGRDKGRGYLAQIERSSLTEQEKKAARQALEDVVREVEQGIIFDFRMKIRGIHAMAFGGQEGGRNNQITKNGFSVIRMTGQAMKKDVITCEVETSRAGGHPAAYPQAIIEELIRLLVPPDGQVVDPFLGSGTTAAAAVMMGRNYLGIEIDPVYAEAARNRLAQLAGSVRLFRMPPPTAAGQD